MAGNDKFKSLKALFTARLSGENDFRRMRELCQSPCFFFFMYTRLFLAGNEKGGKKKGG